MQEDRVYNFLDRLDDILEKIRGNVLQMKPFPTVEHAYAHIRREDLRQSVMLKNKDNTIGSVMLLKRGQKPSTGKPSMTMKPKSTGESGCTHCGNIKYTK